ncbi:hypothetical protein GGX14DRAFT_401057 [Mycena pura]|uniref:Uncharacterized protein n=1 Tax=Mycena pura TaxID=153505 RepID=A0AAD6V858_9AGAR|nr:hypothetical protein GGX14DRAFT_401057 [Mycena pura]
MPASTRKDRCFGLAIDHAPAHLSREEFRANVEAMYDSLVALPVSQKNFLKLDLIFPNNRLSAHAKVLGFGEPPTCLWARGECESADHLSEMIADGEFKKILAEAKDPADSVGFSADVVTGVNVASTSPDAALRIMFLAKAPHGMTEEEFHTKFASLFYRYRSQSRFQWKQNTNAVDDLSTLNYRQVEPAIVLMSEVQTWNQITEASQAPTSIAGSPADRAFQIMEEPGLKVLADELNNIGPNVETWCFMADVITKIDRYSLHVLGQSTRTAIENPYDRFPVEVGHRARPLCDPNWGLEAIRARLGPDSAVELPGPA